MQAARHQVNLIFTDLHSKKSPSSIDPVPTCPTFPSASQPHHSNGSGDSADSKYSQQPHIGQHIGVVFPRLHGGSNASGVARECSTENQSLSSFEAAPTATTSWMFFHVKNVNRSCFCVRTGTKFPLSNLCHSVRLWYVPKDLVGAQGQFPNSFPTQLCLVQCQFQHKFKDAG